MQHLSFDWLPQLTVIISFSVLSHEASVPQHGGNSQALRELKECCLKFMGWQHIFPSALRSVSTHSFPKYNLPTSLVSSRMRGHTEYMEWPVMNYIHPWTTAFLFFLRSITQHDCYLELRVGGHTFLGSWCHYSRLMFRAGKINRILKYFPNAHCFREKH